MSGRRSARWRIASRSCAGRSWHSTSELTELAAEIDARTADLVAREGLLEDHLRSAYERSQTSLLEILLSADSLDEATAQMAYLITVSDQDTILADEIRAIREELETRRATLKDGRRALGRARAVARDETKALKIRREELTALEEDLAALRAAAEVKRAEQEAALNASLDGRRRREAEDRRERARRPGRRPARRAAPAAGRCPGRRHRRGEAPCRRGGRAAAPARHPATGSAGRSARIRVTQEWGPTSFQLEPPYTYRGTYYPHFHTGIDFANGCGTKIYSAGAGVVVASGQPLMPWDSGFGVVVDHGGGIQTWYWHMQPTVVVSPGTIVTSQTVIGYEGTTGMSTGCHVHFAINDRGVWENPRNYLP